MLDASTCMQKHSTQKPAYEHLYLEYNLWQIELGSHKLLDNKCSEQVCVPDRKGQYSNKHYQE